jgi:hypothetical protein
MLPNEVYVDRIVDNERGRVLLKGVALFRHGHFFHLLLFLLISRKVLPLVIPTGLFGQRRRR